MPGRLLLGQDLGLRQRFLTHHRDPGVDFRVPGLDGVETGFGQFYSGKLLASNTVGGLFEG